MSRPQWGCRTKNSIFIADWFPEKPNWIEDDDDDYDSDWDDELETDSTKQESISILGEERRGGIMISDKARKLDLKSNPPDQSSTNKSVTKNNILPRTN